MTLKCLRPQYLYDKFHTKYDHDSAYLCLSSSSSHTWLDPSSFFRSVCSEVMDDAVAEPLEVMDELDMRELLMGASDAREAQAAAGAAAAMANLRAIAGGGGGADAVGYNGSSIAEQEGREGEASMAATDGGDEHRPLRSIVGGRDLDDDVSADYEVSVYEERRELELVL